MTSYLEKMSKGFGDFEKDRELRFDRRSGRLSFFGSDQIRSVWVLTERDELRS